MAKLKLHPTLQSIADLRDSLKGTDFPEQIIELNDLERKAKKGLTLLTLKNNIGVALLLSEAIEKRDEIEKFLIEMKPPSLESTDAVKFCGLIIEKQHERALWTWFIEMFTDSERDMDDVHATIKDFLDNDEE